MTVEEQTVMRSDIRLISLKLINDKKPMSSIGLIDSNLLKEENELYLVMNSQTLLWTFKYKVGGVPPILRQNFTNSNTAIKFITEYLKKRNIEVIEVKDYWPSE